MFVVCCPVVARSYSGKKKPQANPNLVGIVEATLQFEIGRNLPILSIFQKRISFSEICKLVCINDSKSTSSQLALIAYQQNKLHGDTYMRNHT